MVSTKYSVKGSSRSITSNWDRYQLLMWKNWKIFYRNKWGICKDILAPLLFASVLLLTRYFITAENIEQDMTFEALNPSNLDQIRDRLQSRNRTINWELAYSPTGRAVDEFMVGVSSKLEIQTRGFRSEGALLDYYNVNEYPFACVVFNNSLANDTALPRNLSYDIRFPSTTRFTEKSSNWNTHQISPQLTPSVLTSPDSMYADSPYYTEGFIAVQNAVSKSFIEIFMPSNYKLPQVMVQRQPFPKSQMDFIVHVATTLLSTIILISFLPPAMNMAKVISVEKEKQLKHVMKIMGLPDWLHWTTWFTRFIINMLIVVTGIVIILKVRIGSEIQSSILMKSDWKALWVFLMIYSISVITFSFMMSTLLKSPSSASLLTGVVMFILFVPFVITQNLSASLASSYILLMSVFHTLGMGFGFLYIIKLEDRHEGLHFGNMFTPLEFADGVSVGQIMMMLIVSATLYLLITLYVDQILPGDYGVPQKWYFPVTRKFWCGESRRKSDADQTFDLKSKDIKTEAYPTDKKEGISIRNLRKVYSNGKVAVQGLGLNMFEDEITVLLGHNGAGKTTTISMLTGMIPATSGTALINNYDIRTEMDEVRGLIGICPQHNILFDELTVAEHIEFYGRMKGLLKHETSREVLKYITQLQLDSKLNALSSSLSGGMKRKLCVAMALCGDSKIVLLDEPTAGMDPTARRILWNVLQKEKRSRTIILSTHFMDEADVLGDRIGIMHGGELKCYGSSFFLKKEFGNGYTLTFEKAQNCPVKEVSETLKSFIPTIELAHNVGSELSYRLPECYSKSFEPMLKTIEDKSLHLGITGYGISVTTLEEVFLSVGSDNKAEEEPEEYESPSRLDFENGSTLNLCNPMKLKGGSSLIINQFVAMLMKNYFYTVRNYIVTIMILATPTVFMFLTVLAAKAFARVSVLPPLELSLESYDFRTVRILQRNFTSPTDLLQRMVESYGTIVPGNRTRHRAFQTDENLNSYLLRIAHSNFAEYTRHYIAGTSMSEELVIAWFSNQYYHTVPVALQMVYNSILRAVAGNGTVLTTRNHPLPYTLHDQMSFTDNFQDVGFQIMLNMACGMAVGTALYILFYIKERVTKAKLLQFVSGVNVWIFWAATILCDVLKYLVSIVFLVIALAAFRPLDWSSGDELERVVTLMICFGIATLPLLYLFSFVNSDSSNGFNNICLIGLGSVIIYILSLQLRSPFADLSDAADVIDWVFMVSPYYAFGHALFNMNTMNAKISRCRSQCRVTWGCTASNMCQLIPDCCDLDHFQWEAPGIKRNLVFMCLTGLILIGILILRELGFLKKLHYNLFTLKPSSVLKLDKEIIFDSDVTVEKERIRNMSGGEIEKNNLVVRNMSKFYKEMLAVNSLCVGVGDYECFGLLGVNGAGKTTTFKMLTGDEYISSGDAWIKGFSLKGRMKNIYPHIGYCPQFDAMLEDLTGRETMKIFCLLRGFPRTLIPQCTMKLATELNFYQHIDKRIKEYSGGNKRKLSTALALIGDPSVIFLDEPTAGMDPGAKRNLWNVISRVRDSGKTIILTSHSMEECEALCTKITIMVNGEFKCLGSLQYLKNKFSKGFILTVQVSRSNSTTCEINKENINNVHNYILEKLPGSSLKEDYQGRMTYYIVNTNLKWSEMFGVMETAKETLSIENYSLTQTSLEQIFLEFAQHQKL